MHAGLGTTELPLSGDGSLPGKLHFTLSGVFLDGQCNWVKCPHLDFEQVLRFGLATDQIQALLVCSPKDHQGAWPISQSEWVSSTLLNVALDPHGCHCLQRMLEHTLQEDSLPGCDQLSWLLRSKMVSTCRLLWTFNGCHLSSLKI